jgi:bifunctional enzyme CysN/CysC
VAVNKMDLVDYAEEVFDEVRAEFRDFATKLTVKNISFVPVSALEGDNVVDRSERMPWYEGGSLLHKLETVSVGGRQEPHRLPLPRAVRDPAESRTSEGMRGPWLPDPWRPGEEMLVLPSGRGTRIRSVETAGEPLDEAVAGDAVVLTTEDEVDISRGDMIVRKKNLPTVGTASRRTSAGCTRRRWSRGVLCAPAHDPLHAVVDRIEYRVDVDTLHREEAGSLELNEIGRVEISTSKPVFFDSYRVNIRTGSFVLVDLRSNVTVAAGMVRGEVRRMEGFGGDAGHAQEERPSSPNVVWQDWNIPRAERELRNGHGAAVLWFTGMSGAGKSTVAREVERRLHERGVQTMLLDGDQLRHGLCGDLGFSAGDRAENIRRAGEVARLFFEQGAVVLCTFVSPYRKGRERARSLFPGDRFMEIHVHAPVEELKRRDPKGLYRGEEAGHVGDLSGSRAPYEAPEAPELDLDTSRVEVDRAVDQVIGLLTAQGIV